MMTLSKLAFVVNVVQLDPLLSIIQAMTMSFLRSVLHAEIPRERSAESLSGGFGWGTVSEQITYAAQGEDETPTLVHVMAQNWRAITTQFVPAIRSPGRIIDTDKTSESALSIYDVPNRHFGVTPLFAEVVPKELWLVWVNHREKPIAYKLKAVASAKTGYVRGPGTSGNVFDWRDDHAILVTSGGTGLGSSQRVF